MLNSPHPQVHKALAEERHGAVHDPLAKSLGRPVPIDGDWSVVETQQFRGLTPEQQSLVVDTLHAGFPEYLITKGYHIIEDRLLRWFGSHNCWLLVDHFVLFH